MEKFEKGTIEYVINEVKNGREKPSLLLHACCGPCSTSVLEYIHDYFSITVFFYNPNIMPKDEWNKRLEALKTVLSHYNDITLIVPEQSEEEYVKYVQGFENEKEGGARCTLCFKQRLEKCAKYMSENNSYDYFATTLTVSPHKNHILINALGDKIAKDHHVEYLSSNFKKKNGFLRSTQLSKEYDIYRQDYCGCIYSKWYD